MFYSKFLLSNKGSLSTVWVAAHCFRKLKKDQVQQTDISASVEKIIYDEVPVVAHRILAFLLLGVVRIYSKKVDYLFHDCQEILNKLCDFNIGKSVRSGSRVARRLNPTIIVPRSFELDAFDLEIVEDRDLRSGNNRPREQLMLTDGRREEGSTSGLPYMECRSMSFVIADSTASTTPPRDVLSLHYMDQDCFMIPFQSMKSSIASLEILHETGFSLEDRLGPMLLDEEEKEQLHLKPFNEHLDISHDMDHNDVSNASNNNKGDTLPSLEIITGTGACSGHCLDAMGFCNSEKEPLNNELFNDDMGVTGACSGQCLDVLVPDNSEKETFNNEPCSENIGVIIEGPIHHVDFGSNLEMPHESGYSDHCLGVRMLTETENGQPCDVSSDKELIIDEKQEDDALDHSVSPRMLTKTENGQACDVSSNNELIIDEDHVNHNARENLPRFVYTKRKFGAKKIKIPELITQESRNGKIIDVRPVSIDVTPDSKLAGVSVATPSFVTVQTPAPKERKKVFKKRKTLLDLIMVVSTNEYKEWINNTRDLIRKRRKVPHTHLDVWKALHTPPRLLEPSLPCVSIDLPSIQHEKETFVDLSSSEDEARTRVLEVNKVVITNEVEVQMPEGMRSPVCEQIPIAPGTPVTTHLNPLRLHEKFGSIAESDILKPPSSVETESMEKLPSPLEALELNAIFENEMNSPEGDSHETNIYSARTRMIGHYLHKNFLHIKRRERDETLNLSQLLAGRTKKESAMLFYEILVLKTRDCINVHQDSTYGDILLRQTSKLKPSFEFEHGLAVEC